MEGGGDVFSLWMITSEARHCYVFRVHVNGLYTVLFEKCHGVCIPNSASACKFKPMVDCTEKNTFLQCAHRRIFPQTPAQTA